MNEYARLERSESPEVWWESKEVYVSRRELDKMFGSEISSEI